MGGRSSVSNGLNPFQKVCSFFSPKTVYDKIVLCCRDDQSERKNVAKRLAMQWLLLTLQCWRRSSISRRLRFSKCKLYVALCMTQVWLAANSPLNMSLSFAWSTYRILILIITPSISIQSCTDLKDSSMNLMTFIAKSLFSSGNICTLSVTRKERLLVSRSTKMSLRQLQARIFLGKFCFLKVTKIIGNSLWLATNEKLCL